MIKSDKFGHFLPVPHCPSEKVILCAVGAKYIEVHKVLRQLDIEVFPIDASNKLSQAVESHADLQLGMLTGDSIAIGKGEKLLQYRLEQIGFSVLESEHPLSNTYPQEAMLDFLALRDLIIGNRNIIENQYLLKKSQTIHIKQGYAKCNLAVINDHALITSDDLAARVCRKAGFDVLQIQSGYIELPGYDTGFIGGCCGLIAPNQLAVCGDLRTHPNYKEITAFLTKHGVSAITLMQGKLKDIGGIIPMKQLK